MVLFGGLAIIYAILSFTKIGGHSRFRRKMLLFVMLLPAFVLVAFRDQTVGNDTYTYWYGFQRMAEMSSLREAFANSRYEAGYVLVCFVFSRFQGSYYVFQIVISAFIFMSLFRFIGSRSENAALSCFIFLTMRMMLGTMNTVRMWLAIAVLLYSIPHLERKQPWKFTVIVLLASAFHKSSLIFLLTYPMSMLPDKRSVRVIIIFGACVLLCFESIVLTMLTGLFEVYSGYLDSVYFSKSGALASFLSLGIDLVIWAVLSVYKKGFYSQDSVKNRDLNYISYLSTLVIVGIDIVGLGNTIMSRISAYFSVLYLYVVPHLMKSIHKKGTAIIIQIVFVLMSFAQFFVVMYFRPDWNGVTPYQFFVTV